MISANEKKVKGISQNGLVTNIDDIEQRGSITWGKELIF